MKVAVFDGSVNRPGPVGARLRLLLDALAAEGVEADLLWLEKDRRTGCYMCGRCGHRTGDIVCSRPAEDGLRRCVRKVKAADAVVIASPVYSVRGSPPTQALLQRLDHDRLLRGEPPLAGKPAAVVVDPARDGAAALASGVGARLRAHGMLIVGGETAPRAGGVRRTRGEGPGDAAAMAALARELAAAIA